MRHLLVLLLLCPPAIAQQIYKCSTGQGGHAYQSQPCEHGDALRVWDGGALPIAPSTSATTTVRAGTSTSVNDRRRAPRTAGANSRQNDRVTARPARSTTSDRHARCESARARRDREVKRLGMKRTFDQLRALNDVVSAACNHR